MRRLGTLLVSSWLACAPGTARAQGLVARVEASAAGAVSTAPDVNRQYLLRVIPQLDWGVALTPTWNLDLTASADATTSGSYLSNRKVSDDSDVTGHRAWVRLASPRFEARVGLQQISFGSASIFRPLMWFDRVDARDPMQFTNGVYGALARYVTAGNASLWAWGLYGNDGPRGWDTLKTKKDTAEFGGRAQVPLLGGEIAGSVHHRRVDTSSFAAGASGVVLPAEGLPRDQPAPSTGAWASENRAGLDGKWDLGIGVWFEASLTHTDSADLRNPWQPSWVVGADYTFGIGRGLTLLGEHFFLDPAVPRLAPSAETDITAVTATYPFGAVNMLTGAFYYEWHRGDSYRFVEWRRTYDHWRLHMVGFWNPDRVSLFAPGAQANALTGKGFELVIVASY
jgi:hypothetical protein